jgi:hypothetical protein
VAEDLAGLPAKLDRIDAFVADGVLGGQRPNAADRRATSTSHRGQDLRHPRMRAAQPAR